MVGVGGILTLQTRVAVVVFPIPGGPESKAARNPEPSSFLLKNLPGKIGKNIHCSPYAVFTVNINGQTEKCVFLYQTFFMTYQKTSILHLLSRNKGLKTCPEFVNIS